MARNERVFSEKPCDMYQFSFIYRDGNWKENLFMNCFLWWSMKKDRLILPLLQRRQLFCPWFVPSFRQFRKLSRFEHFLFYNRFHERIGPANIWSSFMNKGLANNMQGPYFCVIDVVINCPGLWVICLKRKQTNNFTMSQLDLVKFPLKKERKK